MTPVKRSDDIMGTPTPKILGQNNSYIYGLGNISEEGQKDSKSQSAR